MAPVEKCSDTVRRSEGGGGIRMGSAGVRERCATAMRYSRRTVPSTEYCMDSQMAHAHHAAEIESPCTRITGAVLYRPRPAANAPPGLQLSYSSFSSIPQVGRVPCRGVHQAGHWYGLHYW